MDDSYLEGQESQSSMLNGHQQATQSIAKQKSMDESAGRGAYKKIKQNTFVHIISHVPL